jgi:methylenetetrahydrofolate reductase (NADPH)
MTDIRQELARLLATAEFELVPLKHAAARAGDLPTGSTVSVTASPTKAIEVTLRLAADLAARGLEVVPHLAARMIHSRGHLEELLGFMAERGMDRAFLVGGDATEFAAYRDAVELLAAMADLSHPIREIGIAGYPEGHPLIADDVLHEALVAKASHASYVTTQMCFDPAAIVRWIEGLRTAGIDLPVVIGIPGVVDPIRLATISARIGVGTSIRYVRKHGSLLWRLFRPGPYRPTRLVEAIAEAAVDHDLGLRGIHVFTFNQVAPTIAWRDAQLTDLAGG